MDEELSAMQAAATAIAGLDDEARKRVIRWLSERFGGAAANRPESRLTSPQMDKSEVPAPEEFGDLFHAVDPSTEKERALTAAYWLRAQGVQQFPSQDVNSLLRDLGHKVGNITDAMTAAMRERPALVIQMKKSGTAKQARKLYKLTDAGVRWVEGRLSGGGWSGAES